jgi:succinate-semialdehyde dehydrogenase/glutarate-semialdehyde dehydrogenase
MTLKAINPATNEVTSEYPVMTLEQVMTILEQTHNAFNPWSKTDFVQRSRYMRQAAQILRKKIEHYAYLMAIEMGKPIAQGRADVLGIVNFMQSMRNNFFSPS